MSEMFFYFLFLVGDMLEDREQRNLLCLSSCVLPVLYIYHEYAEINIFSLIWYKTIFLYVRI